jgi:hypothetical protein
MPQRDARGLETHLGGMMAADCVSVIFSNQLEPDEENDG